MNTTTTTTAKPEVKFETPVAIAAKGDSIWEKTEGTVQVDRATVSYQGKREIINPGGFRYAEFSAKGYKVRQHISVDVDGPALLPFWYTDSGVEEAVAAAFKAELLALLGADDLSLSWSEQGMQGDASWNFDVNLFWK